MLAPLGPLDTDEPVAKGVTSFRRRPAMSLWLPSMRAEEWYEADRQNIFPVHDTITLRDYRERLHILTTERYQQASPFSQLVEQRLRDAGRGSADENRVVRRVFTPPERTVAEQQRHVANGRPGDGLTGAVEQCGYPFDRENLCGEMRQEHGLITRSGAHFEYFLMPRELQQLEVTGVDRWLRDRLAVTDWER